MSLILLAALQAAAPAAPGGVIRSDFDLAAVAREEQGLVLSGRQVCRAREADEILVCGRRPSDGYDYPLEEMTRLFAPEPIVAEMSLGRGVTGRVFVGSAVVDRGAVSNRVMIGIKLPF